MQNTVDLNELVGELFANAYREVGNAKLITDNIATINRLEDTADGKQQYSFDMNDENSFTMTLLNPNGDYEIKLDLSQYHLSVDYGLDDPKHAIISASMMTYLYNANRMTKLLFIENMDNFNGDFPTKGIDMEGIENTTAIFKGSINSSHPQIDFQYALWFMKSFSDDLTISKFIAPSFKD